MHALLFKCHDVLYFHMLEDFVFGAQRILRGLTQETCSCLLQSFHSTTETLCCGTVAISPCTAIITPT